jgi:hypothetical protein
MGTLPTKVIQTYKSDTAPNLIFNISREDGTIVSLVGCTVAFIIQDPITKLSTNDPSAGKTNICQITNATAGVCAYSWNSGGTDTSDVGFYPCNLRILYPNNTVENYALTLSVENTLVS